MGSKEGCVYIYSLHFRLKGLYLVNYIRPSDFLLNLKSQPFVILCGLLMWAESLPLGVSVSSSVNRICIPCLPPPQHVTGVTWAHELGSALYRVPADPNPGSGPSSFPFKSCSSPHRALHMPAWLPCSHCLPNMDATPSSLLSRPQTWKEMAARWQGPHYLASCSSPRFLPGWTVEHMVSPNDPTSISSRSSRLEKNSPAEAVLRPAFSLVVSVI